MYNTILRKITSLSLLTILLTSTGAFVLPQAIPQASASHNANLFVSAENAQWNNYIAGPQVIEVVINDNDIKRLDNALGEPDVTVNGKKLRMAQATDGNWYGYFADKTQAQRADQTQKVTTGAAAGSAAGKTLGTTGKGLDFGRFCKSDSLTLGGSLSTMTDTVGFAIPRNATVGTGTAPKVNGTDGTATFLTCSADGGAPKGAVIGANTNAPLMKVIRQNKTLNTAQASTGIGQVGLKDRNFWPFIQLYDLPQQGKVTVNYNKGGGTQSTVLTFDRIPSNTVSLTPDKTTYPINSQIFVTLNDPQLNIDPTDEDTWTWDTSSTATKLYYELYTRNGANDANNNKTGTQNLIGNITGFTGFMFDKNGILTVNNNAQGAATAIGIFQTNTKFALATIDENGNNIGTRAMSFVETSPRSGVFKNWDDAQISNWITTPDATLRGKSATIRYNDVSQSAVLGFGFGTLTVGPVEGEWNSGEKIPVTLVDSDSNKNSKILEHLDNNLNATILVTTLQIGGPFTLASGDQARFFSTITISNTNTAGSNRLGGGNGTITVATGKNLMPAITALTVQTFSQREIITPTTTGAAGANGNKTISLFTNGALVVDLNRGYQNDLLKSIFNTNQSGTTASTRFHGLNMFNYDVRSLNTNATIQIAKMEILLAIKRNVTDIDITAPNVVTAGNNGIQGSNTISLANVTSLTGLININATQHTVNGLFAANNTVNKGGTTNHPIALIFRNTGATAQIDTNAKPITADFFSFGIVGDGNDESQRINNAIYRLQLEETGTDTGTFAGTIEYLMLNQLTILDPNVYSQIRSINHEIKFIAHEDLIQADARAVRLNYLDLGSDGVSTQIAAQQDAPTHSGTVSFDAKNYKVADTVTVTLKDQDLNVDNDLIDIFTSVQDANTARAPGAQDAASDTVGVLGKFTTSTGSAFGRLLDIQFGQQNIRWQKSNACTGTVTGLFDQGFTLVENGKNTGEFKGSFQIPATVCLATTGTTAAQTNANGLNIKVNYVDFRDASGKTIEVSDRAGVRGTTGSVKLDRTVYPVPFGIVDNFDSPNKPTPSARSVFPLHSSAIDGNLDNLDKNNAANTETVGSGDMIIHVRVNDRDYDVSAAGQDTIPIPGTANVTTASGQAPPVKLTVSRGTSSVTLALMGSDVVRVGPIGVGSFNASFVRETGPMTEIAPDAGIFQGDLTVRYTDGPPSDKCPKTKAAGFTQLRTGFGTNTVTSRFSEIFTASSSSNTGFCIRQGDILTVEYTDPVDASGNTNTVTDSATFDLRNGVLQSDKSVYIIGSDMILTLIEPDFNLDSQSAETKSLDLIEWDSHAAKVTMGSNGKNTGNFDAKPTDFRETGKDTGIFQSIIRIPKQLATGGGTGGTLLERGEQIHLEYTDWGPAGSKFVGDENQDIKLTIYTSNFGATVELDQKVYTWTDKVYITVVAPDHNFDSNLIDEIGSSDLTKVTVATRGQKISPYKLVETGVDTGIFTGEVILTGFKTVQGVDEAKNNPTASGPKGVGPTDGFLPAQDTDGVTVSFLYTKDQTVTGSSLIRWNIGEVQWVEASYPANGQGVLRIIDPDMNLNPEAVDKFDTNTWSDSDAGGIKLTMTETNEATGIFEGTVYFTTQFQSSGNRLKVNEGDTVTGEYLDRTLPAPYTPADQLRITATTFIGTIVPPLERAPATNPRIVDAFGNELKEVKVDQQVQITADLANGQDRDQPFAYLVQIQDANGVTVSLSWITGSLTAGQSLNPAQSWTPSAAGTYTAQIFVWESVDNPNALSPPASTTITVV